MLIIYAHPNKEGHCGYTLNKIKEKLDDKDKEYKILDLYEMNFNPVLQPNEHYTSGRKNVTEENKKIQKLIKNEKEFIIIYPTWWNGTPAILKGFFDRILSMGFAFIYKNKIPRGLLHGKIAVITTTGGPVIIEKTILGNRSLKTVVNETLKFCGFQAKGFMVGSARKLTDKQKNKINRKIIEIFQYFKK